MRAGPSHAAAAGSRFDDAGPGPTFIFIRSSDLFRVDDLRVAPDATHKLIERRGSNWLG
jgi:hypothetical protein